MLERQFHEYIKGAESIINERKIIFQDHKFLSSAYEDQGLYFMTPEHQLYTEALRSYMTSKHVTLTAGDNFIMLSHPINIKEFFEPTPFYVPWRKESDRKTDHEKFCDLSSKQTEILKEFFVRMSGKRIPPGYFSRNKKVKLPKSYVTLIQNMRSRISNLASDPSYREVFGL